MTDNTELLEQAYRYSDALRTLDPDRQLSDPEDDYRLVDKLIKAIRELQEELEGVNASHDDEEAAHKQTLRMLKIAQEQVKEHDKELNYLEWRINSDGKVEEFAKHAGKARKRIKALGET